MYDLGFLTQHARNIRATLEQLEAVAVADAA
ncbi:hypothetical protein BH23ACT9_BH23ACT9_30780 [soil metagenome]